MDLKIDRKYALFFALIWLTHLNLQAQEVVDYSQRLGKTNIIKVSPSFYGTSFKGGSLIYETGSGIERLTLQISARYFSGVVEDTVSGTMIPEHGRFEIQPKFYGIRYLGGVYLGAFFVTYSDGTPSLGAAAGVQWIIKKIIAIDANLRLQLRNEIENKNNPSPFFVRPVLTVGILFENRKK